MTKEWILRFAVVLLMAGSAVAEGPANTFEVYPLGEMDVESTTEVVKSVAGPEGQVTLDTINRRLLVITTPENHARLAEIMGKLALPARNVRIEVYFDQVTEDRASGVSLNPSGDVVFHPDGVGGRITVKPKVVNMLGNQSSSQQQTLLVGSGREGSLRIGERVPYLQWILDYGWRGGYITPQLEWQEVGSFLVVQPTVIGNGPMIRIKLIPELRGLVNGRPEHVRFTAVSTEIVAQDGESIALGGAGGQQEFFDRFLVGVASGGTAQALNIRLVPRIQEPLPR